MLKNKKYIALTSIAMSALVLTGCGPTTSDSGSTSTSTSTGTSTTPTADNYLKVWGPSDETALYRDNFIPSFIAEQETKDPTKTWQIDYVEVAEGDAATEVSKNPLKAADVFTFADDHLGTLLAAGAIMDFTGDSKQKIIDESIPWTVEAASADGNLYGIPSISSNGYVMFYEKDFFEGFDIESKTLTEISAHLAADSADVKKMGFDFGNGYYTPAPFFAAGCTGTYDSVSKVQTLDINNSNGLTAFKTMFKHYKDYGNTMLEGNDETVSGAVADGTVKAWITGDWNFATLEQAWGAENVGVSLLPKMDFGTGIGTTRFGTLAGAKIVGIKSTTKNPQNAYAFASYVTTEKAQLERFEVRTAAPANAKAQATKEVQDNVVVATIGRQQNEPTSKPQAKTTGPKWWDGLAKVGNACIKQNWEGNPTDAQLQQFLDDIVAEVTAA